MSRPAMPTEAASSYSLRASISRRANFRRRSSRSDGSAMICSTTNADSFSAGPSRSIPKPCNARASRPSTTTSGISTYVHCATCLRLFRISSAPKIDNVIVSVTRTATRSDSRMVVRLTTPTCMRPSITACATVRQETTIAGSAITPSASMMKPKMRKISGNLRSAGLSISVFASPVSMASSCVLTAIASLCSRSSISVTLSTVGSIADRQPYRRNAETPIFTGD